LSLTDAIQLALQNNLATLSAQEQRREAVSKISLHQPGGGMSIFVPRGLSQTRRGTLEGESGLT
jgi:hypothetical protein